MRYRLWFNEDKRFIYYWDELESDGIYLSFFHLKDDSLDFLEVPEGKTGDIRNGRREYKRTWVK